MKLLLASTSPYRRALLERLGVPFDVASPTFDEDAQTPLFASMTDSAFALKLADGKAESLADTHAQHLILAADQIATVDAPERTLLHKPGTPQRAVDQLMLLAGRTHVLTTGMVLLNVATGERQHAVDQQWLRMRAFDRGEARAYVDAAAPLDCVGAYRIEDRGITLFEAVSGEDITGVMGLPLLHVCRLLRGFGLLRGAPSSDS